MVSSEYLFSLWWVITFAVAESPLPGNFMKRKKKHDEKLEIDFN